MIQRPQVLLLTLGIIVFVILSLSKLPAVQKIFKYLPVPLWCYFIPTLLSTAGIIPSDSPLYSSMTKTLLPACLFLLLVGADLPSILKLSPKALGAMAVGSLGIFAGSLVTFVIFLQLPIAAEFRDEIWRGWGCLSATWTGGSANMIAVKEMIQTPESVFANLIVTDTVIAYGWMALLVFLSEHQGPVNRFLGASSYHADEKIDPKSQPASSFKTPGQKMKDSAVIIVSAFAFSLAAGLTASQIPLQTKTFNALSWTIVLATILPLMFSVTPVRKLEERGASQIGTQLLFLLLTSIGARANLTSLQLAPTFIALGVLWVCIHGALLLAYGRFSKTPIGLLAAASQANVGGPVSAPLVATVFQKDLAPVGVLLAVFGNIYGTYAGLLMAQICRALLNVL